MIEEWKQIPGYEGIYEASSNGRIRTCYGKTTVRTDGTVRVWKQRILNRKNPRDVNGHFYTILGAVE